MSLTFARRRIVAARIHETAEAQLDEIEHKRSSFIARVREMGSALGMSTTDMKCFEDHLTDMESDLFYDEQRYLQYSAENAGDVADDSYADFSLEKGE